MPWFEMLTRLGWNVDHVSSPMILARSTGTGGERGNNKTLGRICWACGNAQSFLCRSMHATSGLLEWLVFVLWTGSQLNTAKGNDCLLRPVKTTQLQAASAKCMHRGDLQRDQLGSNLFSDLAPLLTLFGEQVTKQFLSMSLGWVEVGEGRHTSASIWLSLFTNRHPARHHRCRIVRPCHRGRYDGASLQR